jgi:hypothetical protein
MTASLKPRLPAIPGFAAFVTKAYNETVCGITTSRDDDSPLYLYAEHLQRLASLGKPQSDAEVLFQLAAAQDDVVHVASFDLSETIMERLNSVERTLELVMRYLVREKGFTVTAGVQYLAGDLGGHDALGAVLARAEATEAPAEPEPVVDANYDKTVTWGELSDIVGIAMLKSRTPFSQALCMLLQEAVDPAELDAAA